MSLARNSAAPNDDAPSTSSSVSRVIILGMTGYTAGWCLPRLTCGSSFAARSCSRIGLLAPSANRRVFFFRGVSAIASYWKSPPSFAMSWLQTINPVTAVVTALGFLLGASLMQAVST